MNTWYILYSIHIKKIRKTMFTNDDKHSQFLHFLPVLRAFFSPLQDKFLLQRLPLAAPWAEERERNTKTILSSKQMVGSRRKVWPGRSKGAGIFFWSGWIESFQSQVPSPPASPASPLNAPLPPPSAPAFCQSCASSDL